TRFSRDWSSDVCSSDLCPCRNRRSGAFSPCGRKRFGRELPSVILWKGQANVALDLGLACSQKLIDDLGIGDELPRRQRLLGDAELAGVFQFARFDAQLGVGECSLIHALPSLG